MNFTVLILCIIGGLWSLSIIFNYVTGLGKDRQDTPASSIQAQQLKTKEHQTIEDTKLKQQKMMDDMRQRIADGRRKF